MRDFRPLLRDFPARLASLRLTVSLFAFLLALIFWATLAQTKLGIYEVQHRFFGSFLVWQELPGLGFSLPVFPGGLLLGGLLFLNLAAAHSLRFDLSWKKTGVYLIHFGFFLLLAGGFLTGILSRESQMRIPVGGSSDWSDSFHRVELVAQKEDSREELLFPQEAFRKGHLLSDPKLPFTLRIIDYQGNAELFHRTTDNPASIEWRADARAIGYRPLPLESRPDRRDAPAMVLQAEEGAQALGRWLVSTLLAHPQRIETDKGNWLLTLRAERYQKPFRLTLLDFVHERYPGTETPKSFSSRLLLENPVTGEKREVQVSMNQPLRYGGETFYQSGFADNDTVSILQVVNNPAWVVPYLSSILMAIGLLVHFLLRLLTGHKASKSSEVPTPGFHPDRTLIIASLFLTLAIGLWIGLGWKSPTGNRAYGSLPVMADGRIQPFDTLARNSLLIFSGRSSAETDHGRISAGEWLLTVMSDPTRSDTWPLFHITHPELLSLIGEKEKARGLFSFNTLAPHWEQIAREADAAQKLDSSQRTSYQRAVMRLAYSFDRYIGLKNALHPENDAVAAFPKEVTMFQRITPTGLQAAIQWQKGGKYDAMELNRFQAFLQRYAQWRAATFVMTVWPEETPQGQSGWMNGGSAMIEAAKRGQVPAPVQIYARLAAAAKDGDKTAFQENLNEAAFELQESAPEALKKAVYEARFNRISPFALAGLLYMTALFAMLGSLKKTSWRSAAALLLIAAWLVHSGGLITRMWLEGRPPVTNLYSSAIFIGWGAVLLGLLMELRFRNGLALLSSVLIGLITLFISHHLSRDGDTMGVLIAVLDTNAWLATHVVAITLGYTTVFFAGALGMIDVVGALSVPNWTSQRRPELYRMAFATCCVGLLFSFTGTVLGGLWADQSWGRFWGWDPKENGALLIVLWLALMIHARLGGLVKERGFLLLTLGGNIITAFSWFGTNMLGIGLHSYGFTNQGFIWLSAFWLLQGILITIGLWLPKR